MSHGAELSRNNDGKLFAIQHCPWRFIEKIAAHLRQVDGVNTGFIEQSSTQFDYLQSQLGGLWIEYSSDLPASSQQRLQEILDYYARCHGSWQRESEF